MKKYLSILLLLTLPTAAEALGDCDSLPKQPLAECQKFFKPTHSCTCFFDRRYSQKEIAAGIATKITYCRWMTVCRHYKHPQAGYNATMTDRQPHTLGRAYSNALIRANQYDINSRR